MDGWKEQLKASITSPEQLRRHLDCDSTALAEVIQSFPLRIPPYYLKLIGHPDDPLGRQAIPCVRELESRHACIDPLGEEQHSPTANLVHKYPDRALLLVASQCAMYCRFCTRKRIVGRDCMHPTDAILTRAYQYLGDHPEIREVLLSGGDPLLLEDHRLAAILANLQKIPNIEVVRIGTRVPCVLPMRITARLTKMLSAYHPLYINTHFNHPAEITPDAEKACAMLANAGIPLGNQTVLLRDVNDSAETIRELMVGLLRIRVRPYYLFQADLTLGVEHFRTPLATGIGIMKHLYSHVSGLAVPTFAVDLPGGKGKIPLTPSYLQDIKDGVVTFTNYLGESCHYPDL